MTSYGTTTTILSSINFNSKKKWHSSSFLNSYASSRYVSQVSFSSFIFYIIIAHHFTTLKFSFHRSVGSILRRDIKIKIHFRFNIKPLDLNFRLNRTPFSHSKHWPTTRGKHPLSEKWSFSQTAN